MTSLSHDYVLSSFNFKDYGLSMEGKYIYLWRVNISTSLKNRSKLPRAHVQCCLTASVNGAITKFEYKIKILLNIILLKYYKIKIL